MFLNYAKLESFIEKFNNDETTTLSASLAFYTALSLAPLLIIFVAVTSRISPDLQEKLLIQAQGLVGAEGTTAISLIINGAKNRSDLSSFAGWIGVALLLLSASFIFGELRFALTKIFKCKVPDSSQWTFHKIIFCFLRQKILQMGLTLSFLVLLGLSLYLASYSTDYYLINQLVSLLFGSAFFASMFRYIPYPRVPWSRAWRGGAITGSLFIIGKVVIGFYLRTSAIGSAYGAAGSVVVLMVWIYYSALITLFGAQVSSWLKEPRARKNYD